MKLTIRILITLCIYCISFGVQAHQPDLSSTLLVEQGKNNWVLQVRSALIAFEYEIENHFGKSAYSSPEEFQKLVVDYVQNNIAIKVNGENTVVFQNGDVKLGHETTTTFEVIGMPENIQSLVVKNSSFSNISRNQSALIVVKKGFSKAQFILNNSNSHTVELQVKNSKFELVAPIKEISQNFKWIFVVIGLVLIFFYFLHRRSRSKELTLVSSNFAAILKD